MYYSKKIEEIKKEVIKQSSKKIVKSIFNIIIFLVLSFIVKNNTWDNIFYFIMILNGLNIIFVLSTIYDDIEKAIRQKIFEEDLENLKRKSYDFSNQKRTYNRTYNNSYKSSYNINKSNEEISKSSSLLGINLIQDSNDEIKKKYRKLAMKWHPDKFSNDTLENQEIAKRNFQRLNRAYNTIKSYKNIK